MAYLSGFKNDIFFSYARGPEGGPSQKPLQRWTLAFYEHLIHRVDLYLPQIDPNAVKIKGWIDKSISSTTPVDQTLKQEVEGSALFVCVMSHFYLKSQYCMGEISTFKDNYADVGENRQRIFVVNVTQTIRETWPKALKMANGSGMPGYAFYQRTEVDQEFHRPFGYPDPQEVDPEYPMYSKIIDQLARDIARKIWEMKQQEDASAQKLVPKGAMGQKIFLGLAHDTLSGVRGQVRSRLESFGFTVLPDKVDDPVDQASLDGALTALPACDAAVLIANEYCGLWPKGEPGGLVSYQMKAFRAANKPCNMWLNLQGPDCAQTDAYRAYLLKLPSDAITRFADFEDFCLSVRQTRSFDGVAVAENAFAMIVSNRSSDQASYLDFQEAIKSTIGGTGRQMYVSNLRERSDLTRLKDLEAEMQVSDTLAIVCFDQNFPWASELMGQLRQMSRGDGRKRCQLLVTGPLASRPLSLDARSLDFETIDGSHLDVAALQEQLRQKLAQVEA